MRYSKTALKEHFNIVEYISRYVNLKKAGRNYVGLCPFHKEKTPSFSVSEDKQIFHCFGCGVGGDLVYFLQKYLNLEAYDALLLLEKERGVKLIERNQEFEKRKTLTDKILSINKKATEFFVNNLFKTVEGSDALKYLTKRGVSLETIKKFKLGFGGRGWDGLAKELFRSGFKEDEIQKTGLVVFNQGGRRDFFRNKLIFPIINQRGEVIAFGGRALDNSLPKYINSPEGPVFSKRRNLYGINVAKENIVLERTVIIVEGYIDCLMMHQAGYSNTIATLGTALTEEQIKFLRGLAENFYLIYDGDEAGKKAAIRAVENFLNLGISPYIVTLPEGEDPDSLIVKGESSVLEERISFAKKGVDFLIDLYKNKYPLKTSDDIRSFVYSLGMHVRNIENPLEKELILREVSKITGLSADNLISLFGSTNNRQDTQVVIDKKVSPYDFLLMVLLQKPEMSDYITNEIITMLPDEHREIIEKVLFSKNEDELSEKAKKLFTRLSVQDFSQEMLSDEGFFETLSFLKRKIIKENKEKIDELIRNEEKLPNPDYKKILMWQEEKKQLVLKEKKLLHKGVKNIYEI